MVRATSNNQGELSPLEIGIHALLCVPTSQGKAGGLKAYADAVGRSKQSVSQLRQAAAVANLSTQVDKLRDKARHLAELHALPPECWPAAEFNTSERTIGNWLSRIDKDDRERRDVAIWNLWQQCYAIDDIAERVGVPKRTAADVCAGFATFRFPHKLDQQPDLTGDERLDAIAAEYEEAALHQDDFPPPIYERLAKERQVRKPADSVQDNCPEQTGQSRDEAGATQGVSGRQVSRAGGSVTLPSVTAPHMQNPPKNVRAYSRGVQWLASRHDGAPPGIGQCLARSASLT